MNLKFQENDNSHVVGAARRKNRFPRKILRVILSDGTCMLQPQINDLKETEDWSYYREEYAYKDKDLITVYRNTKDQPVKSEFNAHYDSENVCSSPSKLFMRLEKNQLAKHSLEFDALLDTENAYCNTNKPVSRLEKDVVKLLPELDARLDSENPYYTGNKPSLRLEKDQLLNHSPEFDVHRDSKSTYFNVNKSLLRFEKDRVVNHSPELNPRHDTENVFYNSSKPLMRIEADPPLKHSPQFESRHNTENAYFNTNKPLMRLEDSKFKMDKLMIMNSRLPPSEMPPIDKARETSSRPHKHQHPEPTPEFPYQCDTCDMLFKTIDFLNDHQNTVHHNNRQFACRYCSKRFNDKYNMRKHVLIHVGEKRHRCQFCQKAFLRKDHLRSHLQTHYNRKFGCKICSKSFRTLDLYHKHAKTHKDTPPSYSFLGNAIKSHVDYSKMDSSAIENGVDSQMKKDIGTPSITSSFDRLNITNQSTNDLNVVKEEQFPVTILDDDFAERWRNDPSLSGNETGASKTPDGSSRDEFHTNGISPKSQGFHCSKCGVTFKSDVSLQMHSQRCNGNPRQWQCIKCNIIFDEAKTLKQHYEKVHCDGKPTPNPSRWRCKTCEINYPNSKELSRHYAQAHKDAQIFPCSECPKTFTVWHNLKKHMLIHLGDKKHKCGVCNKGFVRKDHLNSHMKVHLGDGSKFTCPVCCKVFRLKQMYLKHVNLHGLERACEEQKLL